MTNNEIVLDAFDALGGSVNHNKALIAAICRRCTVGESLAAQLVEQALKDGVITMDAVGEIRKA